MDPVFEPHVVAMARRYYETQKRLAPVYLEENREQVEWEDLTDLERRLAIAVAAELIREGVIRG